MKSRITFRTKLLGIVGIAAFSFILLIAINIYLNNRVKLEIEHVQNQYIPIIELGPQFENKFEGIRRSFQDAVAAHDHELLEKSKEIKDQFLELLTSNQASIDSTKSAELKTALEEYYIAGSDVSNRLMKGETGIELVDHMADMQKKQTKTLTLLKETTSFDKAKLFEAFSASTKALDTSAKIQLLINTSCLLLALIFSLWLSRGVVQSLNELKLGFARFGHSDFTKPIHISSDDEFGEVGAQANQMASLIEDLLKQREAQASALQLVNKELESFSYSVAHDLRAPLRSMLGFSSALIEDHSASLPEDAKNMLGRVTAAAQKMGQLVDGLLDLSRLSRTEMKKESIDLSKLVENILAELQRSDQERKVTTKIENNIHMKGDAKLMEIALTNLVGNAWKFTAKNPNSQIEFGQKYMDGKVVYFIKDNGAGFDMLYKDKLFGTFQRLHTNNEFQGTGIGLATVQRIIHRHSGHVWAESEIGQGATFYFTVG